MRKALIVAMAAVVCAGVAACGSSSSTTTHSAGGAPSSASTSKAPVKVALITWKIAGDDELTPMAAGAEAAAKQINAGGGIGGRPLVLTTCNDMLAPAAAAVCAHSTVGSQPVAMIGCSLNWSTTGLLIYAQAKIPSLNCLNTHVDVTNPWSFGINASAIGQAGAAARYFCSLADAKTIGLVVAGVPASTQIINAAVIPVLKGCGKKWVTVAVPVSSVDVTAYVQKVVSAKAQYVFSEVLINQTPQIYAAFEQDGIPPSKILSADVNFTHAILSQAPSMKGGVALSQFQPWTLTSNPDVAAYLKAMQGSPVNAGDPTVEWGYSLVMWLYTSAQHIGAANFNSTTLAQFWRTANNIPIPLTRTYLNPGPSSAPQLKQPYVRLVQWTGTAFNPLTVGPDHDGWIQGVE